MGPGLGPDDAIRTTADAHRLLTAGLANLSAPMRDLLTDAARLVDAPITGELGAAPVLADDLEGLGRLTQFLAVETARRAHSADALDATATGVRSTLVRTGWNARHASAAIRLGAFLARFPELGAAVRIGTLSTEAAAAVELLTRRLTAQERTQVIAWLLSWAASLDTTGVKVAVAAAVEQLHPATADDQEQQAHDERALRFTRFRGMVLFEGRLPALDGEAFVQLVAAYAEKTRAEGDGLSPAQRAADGLTAMMSEITTTGRAPSSHGTPAHVTVLVPISEADRVATGTPRSPIPLPDLTGGVTTTDTGRLLTTGRIADRHTLGDAAARFLLCAADLSGALVTTTSPVGGLLGATPLEPLALGRTRRFASTGQRRALTVRDRGCVVPGCEVGAEACQAHHVTDWAHGGMTDLDQMALLCWVHHRQVDLHRWTLTRSTDPGGPYWSVRPTPRSSWRRRS